MPNQITIRIDQGGPRCFRFAYVRNRVFIVNQCMFDFHIIISIIPMNPIYFTVSVIVLEMLIILYLLKYPFTC